MRLRLTAQDLAFRDEMRQFFTQKIPAPTREKVAAGEDLTKGELVESQRILNAAGLAVPNWPVEWGGRDWTPLRRHIWHEEMQLASRFSSSRCAPRVSRCGRSA
jgi:alkylation response protein AidB-like acyl-CoA dehydrogenase